MLFGQALTYYLFSRRHRAGADGGAIVPPGIREVLYDQRDYPAYGVMRQARQRYLACREQVSLHDLGAGHHRRTTAHPVRTLRSIARHSSGHPQYHRLLYRLVRHYQPAVILETGTALGLGTLALALGNTSAQLFTIEGDPALASRARTLFTGEQLTGITLLEGSFDEKLPEVFARTDTVDMAFLDGHHEEKATLRYFDLLLPHLHPASIVVVDDIHWSAGMLHAWNHIRHHKNVTLTINLFRMGILFTDPDLPSQTVTLRY